MLSQLSYPTDPHAPLSGFKAGIPERFSVRPSYLGVRTLEVNRALGTRAWEERAHSPGLLGTSWDPALTAQSSYKGFCRRREGEGEPRDRGRGQGVEDTPNPVPRHFSLL